VAPRAVFVSYRLGGNDGVAVEARKWEWALGQLGFEIRRVAGAIEDGGRPDDVVLPFLAIDPVDGTDRSIEPDLAALGNALDGPDLVVVENLCSLPINAAAAEAVARVCAGLRGRVLFHHHDLPWQRRQFEALSDRFPPALPSAGHVTINLRSRRELESRGFTRVATLQNRFDLEARKGNRARTRDAFGFADDEWVVLQPSRAIERKNVAGGLRFAADLARHLRPEPLRYWLSGPAEDGYGSTLDRLLARATVPVTLGRARTAADAYAAADVIVLPSTWEGFGNPTIESIVAARPLAAFPYPVLAEIRATGVRFFSTTEAAGVARFLREPENVRKQYHRVNRRRASLSYSLAALPADLEIVFRHFGWSPW
jgi:glycosyltransferase involved in cell wall biosynthesis